MSQMSYRILRLSSSHRRCFSNCLYFLSPDLRFWKGPGSKFPAIRQEAALHRTERAELMAKVEKGKRDVARIRSHLLERSQQEEAVADAHDRDSHTLTEMKRQLASLSEQSARAESEAATLRHV